MTLRTSFEQLYGQSKRNQWFRYFAVFCRIVLAVGFIPSGIAKVMGERFTALPSSHPLGRYFDALHQTGWYYRFIGVAQLTAALLLLIPRTALLGAIFYFPIILNICVLAYAVRFEGTRITTLMLLANLFLLVWDYERLKHVLPLSGADEDHHRLDETSKFPVWFLGVVFASVVSVIVVNHVLYDIRPGNSQIECTNGCSDSGGSSACQRFCDCIYNEGNVLNACLGEYERAREAGTDDSRHPRPPLTNDRDSNSTAP